MRGEKRSDGEDPRGQVRAFWEREACGEIYASGPTLRDRLEAQARQRYALEPYLKPFARFGDARGKRVLEVGLGLGADHEAFASAAPALLAGVDLTRRAAELTSSRLNLAGHVPRILVADAERLPFRNAAFDVVYSWGVLHHSPDTAAAVREVHRVLRPGGIARVMLYHRRSIVGFMLWTRYALLRGRPWLSLATVFDRYMESPGTKAYTRGEARALFVDFSSVHVQTRLTFADLLEGAAGQRHGGGLLAAARAMWPRALLRRVARGYGLDLLIEAVR
jgi:ubiquinone/menaquinone biosynthesis C-methylase UbiE